MDNFCNELQQQGNCIESIIQKIETREAYMEELKLYLPTLNQTILALFEMIQDGSTYLEINQEFILQVLSDIVYGMEMEDPVCLADVLRYGLLEIFDYIWTELQREAHYE